MIIDANIALTFFFVGLAAVSFGMGGVLIYQRREFREREDEMEQRIDALESQVAVLISVLHQRGIPVPTLSQSMTIGGDVAGRDKSQP